MIERKERENGVQTERSGDGEPLLCTHVLSTRFGSVGARGSRLEVEVAVESQLLWILPLSLSLVYYSLSFFVSVSSSAVSVWFIGSFI